MNRNIIVGAVCALLAGGGSAFALSPDAAPVRHLFDGHHIARHSIPLNRLTPKTVALIKDAGTPGQNGGAGPQGPKGPKGDRGPAGVDAPAAEYGVANVRVKRGAGSYVTWATYSTRLGSPVGDTTGGTFRFTCSTANAPCSVGFAAGILSSTSTAAGSVYPRLSITKEDYNSGAPLGECEYADGADNSGATDAAPRAPMASPASTFTTLGSMGIGGTLDCGSSQTYSPTVDHVDVPAGFYNVTSTFAFKG